MKMQFGSKCLLFNFLPLLQYVNLTKLYKIGDLICMSCADSKGGTR